MRCTLVSMVLAVAMAEAVVLGCNVQGMVVPFLIGGAFGMLAGVVGPLLDLRRRYR